MPTCAIFARLRGEIADEEVQEENLLPGAGQRPANKALQTFSSLAFAT